jgi:hypothetical protein
LTKARTNADNVTADIAGITASTGLTGGGTSGTVTLSIDTGTTVDLTTSQALSNKIFVSPEERTTLSTSVPTATTNFDADTQGVLYLTGSTTSNWTLNVRGSGSTTLASKLAVGDSMSIIFIATNGSTAYRHTALTIDGNAQTVDWSGGTAPAAGNASSKDAYSFTIFKTAATPTYTVFGAGPVKYA